MPMKTLSCVCLPDKKSEAVVRKISEEISLTCESKNALSFQPHFSIRGDFKIEDENIPALKEEIQDFCSRINPLNLNLSKYGFYPWRLIFLDIEKNPSLQKLHDGCMKIIAKHKDSWIPEQYKNNDNFEGKQREYIEEHGYHFCFEFFSPHFTVAGNDMREEIFQKTKGALADKKESIKVEVKELIFFDRDNNNQIFMKMRLGEDSL